MCSCQQSGVTNAVCGRITAKGTPQKRFEIKEVSEQSGFDPPRSSHPDQATPINSPRSTHTDQLTPINSPRSTHPDQLAPINSPRSTHTDQLTPINPPRSTHHTHLGHKKTHSGEDRRVIRLTYSSGLRYRNRSDGWSQWPFQCGPTTVNNWSKNSPKVWFVSGYF